MQAGDQSVIRPRPEFIPTGRKYEICANFRNCRKGDACTFAHSEAEKLAWNEQLTISHNTEARPIPTKVTCRPMPKGVNCKPPRGEFMICSNFSRGSCRKEAACTFAHSEEERYQWNQQLRKELNIRNRPKISPPGGKFMQCAKFPNCSYGDRCTYAHSEEELHAWNKELAGDTTDSKPQG